MSRGNRGDQIFLDEMIERIESLSGKRESFSGDQVRMHDEHEAEVLLAAGLGVLGISEGELISLRKRADEKALIAWLLRKYSVVSNGWIAERLSMGRVDCLSRYLKRIEQTDRKNLIEKREALREITRLRD